MRSLRPAIAQLQHAGPYPASSSASKANSLLTLLLPRHWEHNQMWWPRLFRCHGEIAWDDYEKDYSDLPEEVLARHRWASLLSNAGLHSAWALD